MQEWNRYEATKYAFLDFIGRKPASTGAGGEPVNRNEIVLKKDMGYVDRLIGWAGRHPYLSAAGLLTIFLGGGMALGQLYKSKDSDGTAATAAITADAPTPTVAAANGNAVEMAYEFTPGIEIIGSDTYKEYIEAQLEELDKTPNFRIRGMTARQYTEKYLDYLYEAVPGTLENCPKEAFGKKATECLAINFSEASMLLHVARHADQFSGELRDKFKNKTIYEYEKDAVTIQVDWVAERLNLTETKKNELFESLMKKYKP